MIGQKEIIRINLRNDLSSNTTFSANKKPAVNKDRPTPIMTNGTAFFNGIAKFLSHELF